MLRNEWENRVVIITGAASGIGKAAAELFFSVGTSLLLVDINIEQIDTWRNEKDPEKSRVHCIYADVSKEEDVRASVNAAIEIFGKVDVLIANAGIVVHKPVTEITEADILRLYSVNVNSVYYYLKYVIPIMRKQKKGTIVVTASIDGFIGAVNNTLYSGTKHAVIGITKSAALEAAKDNIRINCVCPGAVATPIIRQYIECEGEEKVEEREQFLKDLIPTKCVTLPEEVAQAMLFLASDVSSSITGSKIVLDGGRTAG